MRQDSSPSPSSYYLTTWLALVLSLGAILAVSVSVHTSLAVPLIIVLAVVNAGLMFTYFMHLSLEPRSVKWLVIIPAVIVLILLFGLLPDIVWVYGAKGQP